VDEKKGRAKTDALRELSHRFAAASATSYYCVETGLVRIPKSVRCTRSELQRLEQRIFDGAIAPAKLVALRGSRQEMSSAGVPINNNGSLDGNQQLGIIGSEHSGNNHLNTSIDTSATDQTVLDGTDNESNNASFDNTCDAPRQPKLDEDMEESTSSGQRSSSAATAQLQSAFSCSSATLELCSYRRTRSAPHSSSRDIELGSASLGSSKSQIREGMIHSILRPGERDRSDGSSSTELFSASEYLQQNKAAVVGDNRCRIIDSHDESDGVEVAATTHQTLMDVEDMLLLSATSSNRSEDSSVASSP